MTTPYARTAEDLVALLKAPNPQTREWAARTLQAFYPEACAPFLAEWLAADESHQALAVSALSRAKNPTYLEQLVALYLETRNEALRNLLPGALVELSPERYLEAFQTLEARKVTASTGDLAVLLRLTKENPTPEHYELLLRNHGVIYLSKLPRQLFEDVLATLLKYSVYADYNNILLEFMHRGAAKASQFNYLDSLGAFLHPFNAARLYNQYPPTANVFKEFERDFIGRLILTYPALETLWPTDLVIELGDMADEDRFGEMLRLLVEVSGQQVERLGYADYTLPDEQPGVPHPAVPTPVSTQLYLSGLAAAFREMSQDKVAPVFVGFCVLHSIILLTQNELAPGEMPAEEALAKLKLAERLELAENPSFTLDELKKLFTMPRGYQLSETDAILLEQRMKHQKPELANHGPLFLTVNPGARAAEFLWNLAGEIPQQLLRMILDVLREYPETVFDWLRPHFQSFKGMQPGLFLGLLERTSPEAVKFAADYTDLLYRFNRWGLFQHVDRTMDPVFLGKLWPYSGPHETELNQLLVNLAEIQGVLDKPWEHLNTVREWLVVDEARRARLNEVIPESVTQAELLAGPPLTFELICVSCNHAHNYPITALFLDFAEFDRQLKNPNGPPNPEEPFVDPFFIRDDLHCRNCKAANRLVMSPNSRNQVARLVTTDWKGRRWFHARIHQYQLVPVNKQKLNPRQALAAAMQHFEKNPGDLNAVMLAANSNVFLGRFSDNLALLERARQTVPGRPEVLIALADTYRRMGNVEAAFSTQQAGIEALHKSTPKTKESIDRLAKLRPEIRRDYHTLWELGRELHREKEVEAFLDKFPAALFFPDAQRNEACPCGSGQKLKRCCLNRKG